MVIQGIGYGLQRLGIIWWCGVALWVIDEFSLVDNQDWIWQENLR